MTIIALRPPATVSYYRWLSIPGNKTQANFSIVLKDGKIAFWALGPQCEWVSYKKGYVQAIDICGLMIRPNSWLSLFLIIGAKTSEFWVLDKKNFTHKN